MTDQLAVSMRASSLGVRDCMGECSLHRFERIQINALHPDFKDLSDSGRRDVVATLRRNGLRGICASGEARSRPAGAQAPRFIRTCVWLNMSRSMSWGTMTYFRTRHTILL